MGTVSERVLEGLRERSLMADCDLVGSAACSIGLDPPRSRGMSLQTVIAHLAPLARQLRSSILPGGGDPAMLFNAIVEAGYLVAAADGTVDEKELDTLKSAVATLTEGEMSQSDIDTLLEDLIDLRTSEGEEPRCKAVGSILREANAGEEGIYLASAIAYVSAGLSAPELAVMEKIARSATVSGAQLAVIATSVREEIARRSVGFDAPRA
jgi:tellurite resistance protein